MAFFFRTLIVGRGMMRRWHGSFHVSIMHHNQIQIQIMIHFNAFFLLDALCGSVLFCIISKGGYLKALGHLHSSTNCLCTVQYASIPRMVWRMPHTPGLADYCTCRAEHTITGDGALYSAQGYQYRYVYGVHFRETTPCGGLPLRLLVSGVEQCVEQCMKRCMEQCMEQSSLLYHLVYGRCWSNKWSCGSNGS